MNRMVMVGLLGCGMLICGLRTIMCPADNYAMTWDGRTVVISAQTFYEYKCPTGHTTLVRWDQQ